MGIFDRTMRGLLSSPLGPVSAGGGSGEVNTASNLGSGSQLFKSKVGVDLQFRSLVAGSGISLTQNANDITISASGGGFNPASISSSLLFTANNTYDVGSATNRVKGVYANIFYGSQGELLIYTDATFHQLASIDGSAIIDFGTINSAGFISNGGVSSVSVYFNNALNNKAVSVKAPDTLATNWTLTLPINAGTNGYILSTNGAGLTSWVPAGGGSGATTELDNLTTTSINADLIFQGRGSIISVKTADDNDPSDDIFFGSGNDAGDASGSVILGSGTSDSNQSGDVTVRSGITTAGPTGSIFVKSGDSNDPSGSPSGGVNIGSGAAIAGNSGGVLLFSGALPDDNDGNTGDVSIYSGDTGNGAGISGLVTISSGNTNGGGDTGDVNILTGAPNSGGTRGSVNISARTVGLFSAAEGGIQIDASANTTDGDVSVFAGRDIGLSASATGAVKVTSGRAFQLPNHASDPSSPQKSDMYFNTTVNKIKVYNGTTWETVTSI